MLKNRILHLRLLPVNSPAGVFINTTQPISVKSAMQTFEKMKKAGHSELQEYYYLLRDNH